MYYIEPNLDIKMVIYNSKPFNNSSQVASFTARFTILKTVYWWYLSVATPAGSGYWLLTRCKDSLQELPGWNVIFLFCFCLKPPPDLLLILSCSSSPSRRGPAPKEEGRAEGPRVISVNYMDKGHLCGGQRWVPEDLTDYSVEQHRRSQLGSENQSDFLAQMKFTPVNGTREPAAEAAALLRPCG